jgi:hypothetical protein
MRIDMIGVVTLILVFLAWFVFGAICLFRKKPPKAEETKRVFAAKWGIALQGIGFALVGSIHRAHLVLPLSFFLSATAFASAPKKSFSAKLLVSSSMTTPAASRPSSRATSKSVWDQSLLCGRQALHILLTCKNNRCRDKGV